MTLPKQKAKPNRFHFDTLYISVKKQLQDNESIYQSCEAFQDFKKETIDALLDSAKLISKHYKQFDKYDQSNMLDCFLGSIDETIKRLNLTQRSEDELFGVQIKIN